MAGIRLTQRPGRRACAAPHRPRRQGHPSQGVRRPGDAVRRQALLHPQPAPGSTGLEDGGRRRDRDRDGGTRPRTLDADCPSGRRGARRGRPPAKSCSRRSPRKSSPDTAAVGNRELSRRIASTFADRFCPSSGGRAIGAITREDVQAWFRSLHATPAAANRSAPILSVIMQQAEAWGHRPDDSNPCKGIRRYRQGRSERFLSPEEYRRLAEVLERREGERPFHVAAVRLLVLTGCRKSEILTLQWRFYREGRLYLADSKTGPRTVWLCEAARDVLDRLPRSARSVFPVEGRRAPWMWLQRFWLQVRTQAALEDVRLHDLRHSYASTALLSGESVRTLGACSVTSVPPPP